MVEFFLLLLFVVFTILMIMDFITTEYILKLGGYEKSELLKYLAGKPIWHAIVKIAEILVVFFIISYVIDWIASPYFTGLVILILILLSLGLSYAQINNMKVIRSMQ